MLLLCSFVAKAQQIDSIYVNLYTDSLKKGTYNYINVDGLLKNGRYLPLDSNTIAFSASAGKFFGNSLFIPAEFAEKKITIKVVLKKRPALFRVFEIWVKQMPDGPLKNLDDTMKEIKGKAAEKKKPQKK